MEIEKKIKKREWLTKYRVSPRYRKYIKTYYKDRYSNEEYRQKRAKASDVRNEAIRLLIKNHKEEFDEIFAKLKRKT